MKARYFCEICGQDYPTITEAEACEAAHQITLEEVSTAAAEAETTSITEKDAIDAEVNAKVEEINALLAEEFEYYLDIEDKIFEIGEIVERNTDRITQIILDYPNKFFALATDSNGATVLTVRDVTEEEKEEREAFHAFMEDMEKLFTEFGPEDDEDEEISTDVEIKTEVEAEVESEPIQEETKAYCCDCDCGCEREHPRHRPHPTSIGDVLHFLGGLMGL